MEEAFYTTDRVMTASFHRFGEFFPGTGDVRVSAAGDSADSRTLVCDVAKGILSMCRCAMASETTHSTLYSNL